MEPSRTDFSTGVTPPLAAAHADDAADPVPAVVAIIAERDALNRRLHEACADLEAADRLLSVILDAWTLPLDCELPCGGQERTCDDFNLVGEERCHSCRLIEALAEYEEDHRPGKPPRWRHLWSEAL